MLLLNTIPRTGMTKLVKQLVMIGLSQFTITMRRTMPLIRMQTLPIEYVHAVQTNRQSTGIQLTARVPFIR